jgi:chromatin assembly factor 1 subunit A
MPPPPAPMNAFQALTTTVKTGKEEGGVVKMVPDEDMPKFRRLIIEHQRLSKVGLTDLLSHSFDHVTKKQVENTLKVVAEKVGTGKKGVWELKPGFQL